MRKNKEKSMDLNTNKTYTSISGFMNNWLSKLEYKKEDVFENVLDLANRLNEHIHILKNEYDIEFVMIQLTAIYLNADEYQKDLLNWIFRTHSTNVYDFLPSFHTDLIKDGIGFDITVIEKRIEKSREKMSAEKFYKDLQKDRKEYGIRPIYLFYYSKHMCIRYNVSEDKLCHYTYCTVRSKTYKEKRSN